MVSLETNYMGLKLNNPIIVASSGLTNAVDKMKNLESEGAAAIVMKSIFEEQINEEVSHLINRNPRNVYPEDEDYLWNFNRNNAINRYLNLLREAKKELSIPVIASINCVSSSEWIEFAKEFENAGADALELNIYIVPTDRFKTSAEIEDAYLKIVSEVKKQVSIPVSIKIGIYFTNLISMADRLISHGANALVLFNRFNEPDINIGKQEITSSEILSSPAELRHCLRWTGLISAQLPQVEIAASTGIHEGEAVIRQLLAGAQVVQICSTIYINGPAIIGKMMNDLVNFMNKNSFKTIEDFRGRLSYNAIPDPILYERAQFMKYLSMK